MMKPKLLNEFINTYYTGVPLRLVIENTEQQYKIKLLFFRLDLGI